MIWTAAEILVPLGDREVAPRSRARASLPRIGVDVERDALLGPVRDDDSSAIGAHGGRLAVPVAGRQRIADRQPGRDVEEDDRAVVAGRSQRSPIVTEGHAEQGGRVRREWFANRPT